MAGCKVMPSRQEQLSTALAGMQRSHLLHFCTSDTSLVHRHGLNMRVKVSSAVPTFGPGPMMLLCRPPPPELLATRTNFVSGAVLVLQPSQSNITAV